MAKITGKTTETTNLTIDPIAGVGGTTYYKQAKANKTATGLDEPVASQVVAFDAGTATLANVAGSASSVTLLAANTGRLGAVIVNDSTAVLYVKFGSTASTTSFTYKLEAYDTLEVGWGYTGIITGIWASATGSARTTELTA